VGSAQLARTTRDLALLTDDIPDPEPARRARPMPTVHRALFSHLVRRGPLELAPRSSFRSVFGTIDLDLRGATIPSPELELVIYNLFGTVTVLVPEGADVRVEGGLREPEVGHRQRGTRPGGTTHPHSQLGPRGRAPRPQPRDVPAVRPGAAYTRALIGPPAARPQRESRSLRQKTRLGGSVARVPASRRQPRLELDHDGPGVTRSPRSTTCWA
jgi:Cell wall-active antibiotics response 4TMS YvqF